MKVPTVLVRGPGHEFTETDLIDAESGLRELDNPGRIRFRNANSKAISEDASPRILIVAGPGAGKSFLFMDRIRAWLKTHPQGSIHVASFVRKLVIDLRTDVDHLDPKESERVEVSTLHTLARSVIERNGGTKTLPLGPYVRVVSQYWEEVVWDDTCNLKGTSGASLNAHKDQYHNNKMLDHAPWPEAHTSYAQICSLYNAVGFGDLIVLATQAVTENPELVATDLWILDEFQDFNAAEDELISALTKAATGVLLAGDDDQALYQKLKSSHPEIIRSYYKGASFAKGLLPFCSRCSFHITLAAEHFLNKTRGTDSIRKIFLPLQIDELASRVQVVAFTHPSTVAGYIEKFIDEHRMEIEKRSKALESGEEKDPYLLILSFPRNPTFLTAKPAERVEKAVAEWRLVDESPGPDYLRALLYRRCSRFPNDNFSFRKVLHYENAPQKVIASIIHEAIDIGMPMSEGSADILPDIRSKCHAVQMLLDDEELSPKRKVQELNDLIGVEDDVHLESDLASHLLGEDLDSPGIEEEEIFTIGSVSAVEQLSMAGAKGLSADHVIVLGCDQLNMRYATPQLFFVAMTRARRSLHLIASLKSGGASKPHKYLATLPEDNCIFMTATQKGLVEKERYEHWAGWIAWMQNKFENKGA